MYLGTPTIDLDPDTTVLSDIVQTVQKRLPLPQRVYCFIFVQHLTQWGSGP